MTLPSQPLPSPSNDQPYCEVSALEAGLLKIIPTQFTTSGTTGEVLTAPSLAFLLQHSTRKEKFLFDLGIRKDWRAYPQHNLEAIETFDVDVPQDVVDSLAQGGTQPADIPVICLSHLHYDHVGNPSLFPASTFLLGEETKQVLTQDYSVPFVIKNLPFDRVKFLDTTDWHPIGPFPRAFDFYGDALRRLMREITELKKSPPEGIRIQTSEEDILDVTGIIQGPVWWLTKLDSGSTDGTPYAGGYFRVKFKFTEEFPAAPPKCWFATKIFHPNVSSAGEICVNTLKKDWKPNYGIEHILVTVKCLLIYPNPESALDEEAGKLLLENYSSYCDRAKLITSVHATPRKPPVEFDTPSPVESSNTEASSSTPSSTAPKTAAPTVSFATPTSQPSVSIPLVTRKSASPAPPTKPPSSGAKDSSLQKERHPSPSPLGTADANVEAKTSPNLGMGMAVPLVGSKAVKRAATGGATTGAEKRKKALKRL
ncbi:hypothetical protein H0H93_008980 [Arthromyces matolae]|nr:hypothetical protein H0H93_008980 [Arthromyces matolae]